MNAAATGWALALLGWVLLIGGIATENTVTLVAATAVSVLPVVLWALTRRKAGQR